MWSVDPASELLEWNTTDCEYRTWHWLTKTLASFLVSNAIEYANSAFGGIHWVVKMGSN